MTPKSNHPKASNPGNKDSNLVQIGRSRDSHPQGDDAGMSRRGFLKVLGAAPALGLVGCADDVKQKVYPHVKGQEYQVPGEAVWYRSTCTECTAGCGVDVRTREGRVVKVEGSKDHPVNTGGLCGLGQSALQALYDPDRVRQPLENKAPLGQKPQFEPISWDAAYKRIASAMKDASGGKAMITGETSGSLDTLMNRFSEAFGVRRVVHDITQPVAMAKASELVYGSYGIPELSFDKADVVLNFGADFLETWVSPVGYARDWARTRRSHHPCKVIHVEPRLSLTGANADLWLKSKPGSDKQIALAILKDLVESGKGTGLSDEVQSKLKQLVRDVNIGDVAAKASISAEKILLASRMLKDAKKSLVVAGGASALSTEAMSLQVIVAFINLVLSNVGKTIQLERMRTPQTSLSKLSDLITSMSKGEVDVLFVHGTNPAFSLPNDYGLEYAARRVGLIVSFNSHLDETSMMANLILPSSHALESWGDVNPMRGVHSIVQPAMTSVFDTRSIGDMLLEVSTSAGKSDLGGESKTFLDFMKARWRELHASEGIGTSFDSWWRKVVERGGYFREPTGERVKVKVGSAAFDAMNKEPTFSKEGAAPESHEGVVVYPYLSVRGFDGRAANRPWLQELPDPITTVVWDTWVELHPKTAKNNGLKHKDVVTVRNAFGEINVPVYVTEHVAEGVAAVPIGQGHSSYGRYARELESNGNVLNLLPASSEFSGDGLALVATKAKLLRSALKSEIVITQGSDSQYGRELARTKTVSHASGHDHHDDHGSHHGGHHEPKQMYEQRVHPLYHWAMVVDLAACTGCSACVVACSAENNIPFVGKRIASQGREMSWLRIERYYEGDAEELQVSFLPMMCQQCGNAPCEPVCPVYATYHNEEGLNVMVYNRCVGTRYCSNNCSYKVRRYNWFEYDFPAPLELQLNPDVTKRSAGVMEKCTFCVQRITKAKDRAKDLGRLVEDGEVQPACVQSCPTQALTFGNMKDPKSKVSKRAHEDGAYKVLDHHLNTQPAITYLENLRYKI